MRIWLSLAALSGAALIGLGAYGAHGLAAAGADAHATALFDTAWRYHALQTLALLAVAILGRDRGRRAGLALHATATLFVVGTVLFSGTLYLQAVTGASPLPLAAPAGGLALILGWLVLAVAALLL